MFKNDIINITTYTTFNMLVMNRSKWIHFQEDTLKTPTNDTLKKSLPTHFVSETRDAPRAKVVLRLHTNLRTKVMRIT